MGHHEVKDMNQNIFALNSIMNAKLGFRVSQSDRMIVFKTDRIYINRTVTVGLRNIKALLHLTKTVKNYIRRRYHFLHLFL